MYLFSYQGDTVDGCVWCFLMASVPLEKGNEPGCKRRGERKGRRRGVCFIVGRGTRDEV